MFYFVQQPVQTEEKYPYGFCKMKKKKENKNLLTWPKCSTHGVFTLVLMWLYSQQSPLFQSKSEWKGAKCGILRRLRNHRLYPIGWSDFHKHSFHNLSRMFLFPILSKHYWNVVWTLAELRCTLFGAKPRLSVRQKVPPSHYYSRSLFKADTAAKLWMHVT